MADQPVTPGSTAAESCSEVCYPDRVGGLEGALSPLPERLAGTIEFDAISLEDLPASKRVTLWFRQGAKHIFYISLVRKGGKCLARMGGQDPAKVLACANVCRDYFDRFFGLSPDEIRATLPRQARPLRPRQQPAQRSQKLEPH